MRRTLATALSATALSAAAALATDYSAPDWRGVTSSVCFGFSATDDVAPFNLAPDLTLFFGDPDPSWVDIGPRITPVQLPDGWMLHVDFPSLPADAMTHMVRIQLDWEGDGMLGVAPEVRGVTGWTTAGPRSAKLVDASPIRILKDDPLGGGWRSYDFALNTMPQWDRATVFVPTELRLTGMMIDAGPVPGPGTLMLAGAALAFGLKRRR